MMKQKNKNITTEAILKHLKIPTFHHALYNLLHPSRSSLQAYIRKCSIKSYFAFAYEYKKNKFKFALAMNVHHYIQLYELIHPFDRHFYALYLHAPRHFYIDIL
eukprot:30695_1